ncbi:helix-turn-helix transcriptional regulator [Streptomyces sp. SID10815]|nr:helix-turn-helix transcriptional regulator [Streptomyces sp. SID10815]
MTSSGVEQARQALGRRLREIRRDAGLTARELARRAGRHESACSRLAGDGKRPDPEPLRFTAAELAAAGIDVARLGPDS